MNSSLLSIPSASTLTQVTIISYLDFWNSRPAGLTPFTLSPSQSFVLQPELPFWNVLKPFNGFPLHLESNLTSIMLPTRFCWIYSPYQSLQPYLMLHCTFAHYNSATRTYLSFPKAQLYFSHLKYFIHHISSAIFTLYSILCLASFYHP